MLYRISQSYLNECLRERKLLIEYENALGGKVYRFDNFEIISYVNASGNIVLTLKDKDHEV